MVNKFNLIRTPRILFGRGQAERLSEVLKAVGRNSLVILGGKSHKLYPVLGRTFSAIEKEGHSLYFEQIGQEPSPAEIDRITDRYRSLNPDSVIAVGGGSVVDAGKAVSAMLPFEGTVKDYLEGVGTKTHTGIKKFFIAIPTTSGTGSEATANAVLSETGLNGYKRSLRHENLVPDVALVDPELTLACPPEITASSGMDAFTQLIESYLSVKSNPVTDALALDGILQVHSCLERAIISGDDPGARSGMSYAALLSGITLANAGLGLIHGFASSVGGFFRIPHGVVCGTMMGIVNRYNVNALLKQDETTNAHKKYGMLGMLLSERQDKNRQWYMNYVADYIDERTERFHIHHLGEYGIGDADLLRIAENTDHKGNPVKFEKDKLVEMLRARL